MMDGELKWSAELEAFVLYVSNCLMECQRHSFCLIAAPV